MSLGHGASIIRNGLVLQLDAANGKSYPGTDTTWFDLSGNQINGTLNGPTFSSGSFTFDGINDVVTTTFDARQDFTLCCWANPTVLTGPEFRLFGQGTTSANNGLNITHISNTPTIRFSFYANDMDFNAPTVTTGKWTYYSFTYLHSSPYTKQAYIDGVLSATANQSQYSGTGTFRIGAPYSAGGPYASGKFSVIQIYNRILSSSEIQQNFNSTRSRYA